MTTDSLADLDEAIAQLAKVMVWVRAVARVLTIGFVLVSFWILFTATTPGIALFGLVLLGFHTYHAIWFWVAAVLRGIDT